MDYITVASLAVIFVSIWLVYHLKRKKRAQHLVFQKKRLSRDKRRRHTLLDRNRGKVIPFPSEASSLQQGEGQSDYWGNNNK